jgi:hypothetical protein
MMPSTRRCGLWIVRGRVGDAGSMEVAGVSVFGLRGVFYRSVHIGWLYLLAD